MGKVLGKKEAESCRRILKEIVKDENLYYAAVLQDREVQVEAFNERGKYDTSRVREWVGALTAKAVRQLNKGAYAALFRSGEYPVKLFIVKLETAREEPYWLLLGIATKFFPKAYNQLGSGARERLIEVLS